MKKVLLLGKTGPIGAEFVRRLDSHEDFELGSPDLDWRTASYEAKVKALMDCTAVVSAIPRRHSLEVVEGIAAINPGLVIYDCSGIHRGKEGWEYALPELNPQLIKGTTRLVGPGCFATAASLALWPIRNQIDTRSAVHIEAIGGASTGGKKWVTFFEENPEQDLIVPNTGLNHPHIPEIKSNLGVQALELRMVPQLARRYRGTTMAIHGDLKTSEEVPYSEHPFTSGRVVHRNKTPQWGEVVGTDEVHVYWVQEGSRFTVHVAFDNLGKGSVGQALQSLAIVT
jgi:N-acetyl-gamma-glutamylphosphate reductase